MRADCVGRISAVDGAEFQPLEGHVAVERGRLSRPLLNGHRADVPKGYIDARQAAPGEVVGQLVVLAALPPVAEGTRRAQRRARGARPSRAAVLLVPPPGSGPASAAGAGLTAAAADRERFFRVVRELEVSVRSNLKVDAPPSAGFERCKWGGGEFEHLSGERLSSTRDYPARKFPWKPNGTRALSLTMPNGFASKSCASIMCSSLNWVSPK